MSTIVGNVVSRVQTEHPEIEAEEIARALAVIAGAILLFIGLTRLGFIVEFIPLAAITSFMTGAAISIAAGQVSTMMGIKDVDTRGATYMVIIDTLKNLPNTKLDAAMGLTALAMLYIIRIFCSVMSKRFPSQRKTWFFISTLRMVFVILLYTMISWLANRGISNSKEAKFSILGHVPSGFQHTGAPRMRTETLAAIAPDLPATVIVLIIEHIAISKSFGRINNYIIDPSQELVAVGFTNVIGPFLGAYPATGSFSRTAIKAKAGVRTPFAGIFTAVIVLLALYALTSVFFYIPKSSLAGLIIHAVLDLVTPPRTVYHFWKTSPLEVVIFFAGVFVSIFTTIENGIYVTVALSAAVLLWNIARSRGKFLGQVRVVDGKPGADHGITSDDILRQAYVPLDRSDGVNPSAPIEEPYPGVFIYRFVGGFNYLNSALHFDTLSYEVHKRTRQTETNKYEKKGVSAFPLSSRPTQVQLLMSPGPTMERPRPSGQAVRRARHAPHPPRHHPRLLLRQLRRRHFRPGPRRLPEPARAARDPRGRGVAPRQHHRPLDQARPRRERLRAREPGRGRERQPHAQHCRRGVGEGPPY